MQSKHERCEMRNRKGSKLRAECGIQLAFGTLSWQPALGICPPDSLAAQLDEAMRRRVEAGSPGPLLCSALLDNYYAIRIIVILPIQVRPEPFCGRAWATGKWLKTIRSQWVARTWTLSYGCNCKWSRSRSLDQAPDDRKCAQWVDATEAN